MPMSRFLPVLLVASAVLAAETPRHEAMDYGPFLTASIENPRRKNSDNGDGAATDKAVVVRLGKREAAAAYDTDTLRLSGAWTGGWLALRGVTFDAVHGDNPGPPDGASVLLETNPGPGWCPDGAFADPRKVEAPDARYAQRPLGPLPATHAKYRGLFLHGERVILSYTVGKAAVLESPDLLVVDGRQVIVRDLTVAEGGLAAWVKLADLPAGGAFEVAGGVPDELRDKVGASMSGGAAILSADGAHVTVVAVAGVPSSRLSGGQRLALDLRGLKAGAKVRIAYVRAPVAERAQAAVAADEAISRAAAVDLVALTKGGPARWTETTEVRWQMGEAETEKAMARLKRAAKPDPARIRELEAAPYLVDTLPVPEANPYGSWMRVGAIDFLDGNRIAFSTWSGDVWVSTDLGAKDGAVRWKRFATGLFHPLGLKVIKGDIHVLGRDQITRLRDLNGDGEADAYENVNNDVKITSNFHEFAFDLQVDRAGNLYFLKGGPVNPGGRGWGPLSPHHGCIFRLPPDGSRLDIIATGVRAPNGMGIGPNDEVSNGDNQGTWVPVDYLNILPEPGPAITKPHFVAVPDLSHLSPKPDKQVPRPLCWLPMDIDNSNGGQAWVTDDRWGPFKGRMTYTSYGKSSLFLVLQERVGDVLQGGVVKFPLRFTTGIMRPRFSPVDGQLYVAGLKGWQSNAVKDGAIHRVRHTGKSVTFPTAVSVTDAGITVRFSGALDAATAGDVQNYALEQNNYVWSADYGSPELKVGAKDAGDKASHGTTAVPIRAARLAPDRRSVFLEVPGLVPVMTSRIKLNVRAEDGSRVPDEVIHTIHAVPPAASPGKEVLSLAPAASRADLGWLGVAVAIAGLLGLGAWIFRLRFGCCGCGKCARR